jgi:hypothetical protein
MWVQTLASQITFNANSRSNVLDGSFLYGSNMGWYGNNWSDEQVADILVGNPAKGVEGVGVNSLRPALYEYFLEEWGYDVRTETFRYYQTIGARNNTAFIGYPSDEHRENRFYCEQNQSGMFANLYEPIWDNGENGTPVNDRNTYALYVYKTVTRYHNQVKFWEVWNEPDFTTGPNGDKESGEERNWWDNDPDPCDLYAFYAPIQSYIRLLRISYEVIKSVDPEAFVCVGGIGYASFLDAVLRNTDNPDKGKVTAEYPQKGGAWFDCVSFHIYPMYYLREWNNDIGNFDYYRTSDRAVQAIVDRKASFQELIRKYGYGSDYPDKSFIITETNIPSKPFDDMIGSDEAQRNFLIKAAVACQKAGIGALYVYGVADEPLADQSHVYTVMGLYEAIPEMPYNVKVKDSGIAWRTVSRQLGDRKFDKERTQALNLPPEINGGAFYASSTDDYVYALWAVAVGDNERRKADYVFPESWKVKEINGRQWNETGFSLQGNKIELTESPVFVQITKDASGIISPQAAQGFTVNPTLSSGQFTIGLEIQDPENVRIDLYNIAGSLTQHLLINRELSAGYHSLPFDLNLSPGIYILVVSKKSGTMHKKIVIR